MATKYISSITLPNGDVANLVDKSSGYTTNTGTMTDVKVGTTSANASSVVSSGVATLIVNTAYNASSNKIATMSDIAAATSGVSDVKINNTSIVSGGIANIVTESAYDADENAIATMIDVPNPSSSTPSAVGTTASAGSAITWSKSDHVHNITSSTITSALGYTPPTDDTKVKLTSVTSGSEYPIVLGPSSITSGTAYEANYNSDVTINPNSKQISLKQIKLSYNADSYATININGYNGTSTNNTPKVQIKSYRANTSGGSDYNVLLQNIATPSANTDAANKKYVDDSVSGLGPGTVTSVGLSNASGETDFTIASSPVTSSGTITITHANSVTAQSTKAVYPISFDKHGHITGSNSAVTIPTAGTTATAVGTSSSGGSATTYSKSDHVHNITSTTVLGTLAGALANQVLQGNGLTSNPSFDYFYDSQTVLDGRTTTTAKSKFYTTGTSGINSVKDALNYIHDHGFMSKGVLASMDLNSLLPEADSTNSTGNTNSTGCWELVSTNTYANTPNNNTTGYIEVYGISTSAFQEFHDFSTNNRIYYIRHYNGSSWSDWIEKSGLEKQVSWSSGTHDADDAEIGLYFCRRGTSYTTNLPGSDTYGLLFCIGRAVKLQFYVGYSTSGPTGLYIRFYANSQWYSWGQIGGGAQYNNLDEVSF